MIHVVPRLVRGIQGIIYSGSREQVTGRRLDPADKPRDDGIKRIMQQRLFQKRICELFIPSSYPYQLYSLSEFY